MDYKKKYEQAMFRMNKWVEGSEITDPKEVSEFVFPELKESEDERIRKSIIGFLKTIASLKDGKRVSNEDFDSEALLEWADWLEKQGEQSLEEKVNEAMREVEEKAKAFTAKHKGETTEEILAQMRGEQKPSEWSEENEKHYQGCLNLMKLSLDTKPYPYYNDYLWLKSLKERIQLKPKQEWSWSEEDEDSLDIAIRIIQNKGDDCAGILDSDKAFKWLKSLKERMKGE